ncbi:pyridoxal kinase [Acidipropionibacterium virtanenii]|uniref:pyridoxal kinase n=1 Tax=Acidipropionibacterium virtanenii TaxID=2057246 RepID=A0A344UUD7_9ACTN|nr:pyridoxal kinase [Acidipropionibacterium virtanenii]AXE38885.1 Pyridoxal kinase PdxY [Acidipropionibacterium virtanenii]
MTTPPAHDPSPAPTVLSIQSHVTVGAVGNSAAVFALQRMGVETWALPTVVLSNDNARPHVAGPSLSPAELRSIVDAMAGNDVLGRVDALLSGYLTGDTGPVILETAARLREESPALMYCCDPVMGDADKGFYVPPEVRRFFCEQAVKACDVLTPNLFELGALTGSRPVTLGEIVDAARSLVGRGPATVLVTSVACRDLPGDRMHMVAVRARRTLLVSTPLLDAVFDGSGDLTTAVFLANLLRGRDLAEALGRTAGSVHAVLSATARLGRQEPALVAAQDLLVNAPAARTWEV